METPWREYECELEILDKIYGGIPKSSEMLEGFIKGKKLPEDMKEKLEEEMGLDKSIEEDVDAFWTGFKQDDTGLYIETRQVKAMLKEAIGEAGLTDPGHPMAFRGIKSRVAGAVFPKGQGGSDSSRLYLYTNGGPATEPDGHDESIGHIFIMGKGKVGILKRKDYVLSPTIKFTLKVGNPKIKEKMLVYLLEFAQELGLGADRSMEHGKFKVTKFKAI